jgi:hypothetical protein
MEGLQPVARKEGRTDRSHECIAPRIVCLSLEAISSILRVDVIGVPEEPLVGRVVRRRLRPEDERL